MWGEGVHEEVERVERGGVLVLRGGEEVMCLHGAQSSRSPPVSFQRTRAEQPLRFGLCPPRPTLKRMSRRFPTLRNCPPSPPPPHTP